MKHLLHYGLLLLTLLLLPALAPAQTLRWERSLSGVGGTAFYASATTADGGYIEAGATGDGRNNAMSDTIIGGIDIWVVKFDAQHVKQWDRRYGGYSNDFALSTIQTADGGYLVGSASLSGRGGDKSQDSRGFYDYWVLKLDAQGRKVWDRRFGAEGDDQLFDVRQTADGGYLLAGSSTSTSLLGDKSQVSHGGADVWLVKLDAQGNKLWDRTLGGDDDDGLVGCILTADGGCLLTGNSFSAASGDVSEPPIAGGTCDYWVVKLDALGTKQWDHRYGGPDNDTACHALQTADGGYYVVGVSVSGVGGTKTQPSWGGTDLWLLRLTAQGAVVWDRRFGTPGDEYPANFSNVLAAAGGGCILTCISDGGQAGDKTQLSRGFRDCWLVRVAANGTLLWDRTYGSSSNDSPFGPLLRLPGGDLLLTANTGGSAPSGDLTQTAPVGSPGGGWLLVLDSAGVKRNDRLLSAASDETQRQVLNTRDGGFLLGGQALFGTGLDMTDVTGAALTQPWLLKRDSLGVALWDRAYGSALGSYLRGVQELPDQSLLLSGTTQFQAYATVPRDDAQPYLSLLDRLGQTQWGTGFGGPADDWLAEARPTRDGGYVLGATSRSGIGGDRSEASRGGADFWLLKLNFRPVKTWDHRYGGTGRDSLVSLRQTADGGYLLAGSTTSPLGGDVTAAPRGGADYWLVKVNALGTVLWQGRYGGPGDDWLAQARPTPDGGCLLLGTTTSAPGGENTDAPRGRRDLWAVKVSATGVLEWQHRYGGAGNEYAAALEVDPDGGFVVGASTTSAGGSGDISQPSRGGTDYWLLRLSAQGTVLWDQRLGGSGEDVLTCLTTTRGYGYALGGQSNSPTGSGEHQQPNKGGYDYWTLVLGARRVPAPTITSFAPALGLPGTVVVLTGTGFTGTSRVSFNGTVAPGFAVSNGGTTLTVTLPAGASTGPVVVTANGSGTAATPFVVPVDLVISTAQTVQGTYRNVTVTGPATGGAGVGTLGGPLAVLGTLTVQDGGTLLGAGQPLTGSGNFVLDAGGTLGTGHASGLRASGPGGAVQLAGSRAFSSDASYAYTGPAAQTTGDGLPAQVRNLAVQNPAGLTLTQAVAVAQVLRLTSGDLTTNGQTLTLRSSAAGTALVDNAGGVVRGNATVQRFVSPLAYAGRGYRHFAAPVAGATVASLAAAGFVPEVSQGAAYNASATPGLVVPFPTVYGYDERRLATSLATAFSGFDRGWVAPTAPTDPLAPGRGYTVQFPAGATAQFVGPLHNGPYTLPLTRTAAPAALAADAGWHLVGNPYPSPLDWRLLPRPAALDDAVYVFEPAAPYAGRYRAWVNGFGPAPLVGSGQGFFVRVNTAGAAPVLAFGNAARRTTFGTEPAFGRGAADGRPVLRLALAAAAADPHDSAAGDETTVYFEAGATPAPDARFDAHKRWNPGAGPSLASLAGSGAGSGSGAAVADVPLAINGLPPLAAPLVVPLALAVPAPGAYAFAVAELANFGPGTAVYLRDANTGTRLRLTATARYACTLAATTAPGRFALEFRPAGALATASPAAAAGLTAWPNPARAVLHADWRPGRAPATLTLTDALGRVLRQRTAAGGRATLDTAGLPAGLYLLRLTGEQSATLKVLVE